MYLRLPLAGFDEGLEAEGPPPPVPPRVVLAHPELADGEAQEVKPHPPFMLLQGVGDERLARLQFQAHAPQPGRDDLLALLDDGQVRVQYDQVVCVADHGWRP